MILRRSAIEIHVQPTLDSLRYVGLLSAENEQEGVREAARFDRQPMLSSRNKVLVEPQRLQTLMTLYSSSLCGIVLLVPTRIRVTTADIKESA